MRSIKIEPKFKNSPSFDSKLNSNNSSNFGNSNENSLFKDNLVNAILEICFKIEGKTSLKLNMVDKISQWMQEVKGDDPNVLLNELRTFVMDNIDQIVQKNQPQTHKSPPQRLARVKSQQRIKLRVFRGNEAAIDQYTYQTKQEQRKDRIIYNLKQQNKRLEKKLLLVISEFSQIKKQYEAKMDKYRKLLNNSLANFQMEVQREVYGYNFNENQTNSLVHLDINQLDENGFQETRYPKTTSRKGISQPYEGRTRGKELQSSKFITIPTIPVLQFSKKANRLISPKHYTSK